MIGAEVSWRGKARIWKGEKGWRVMIAKGLDHFRNTRDIIVRGTYEPERHENKTKAGYNSERTKRGFPKDPASAYGYLGTLSVSSRRQDRAQPIPGRDW